MVIRIRQRLVLISQFGNASWSFLTPSSVTCVSLEVKLFELRQAFQMHQSGVGDFVAEYSSSSFVKPFR